MDQEVVDEQGIKEGWTRDQGGIVSQLLISVPLPSRTTRTKTWNATSTATTAIPSTSNGGASGPQ